MRLDWFYIQEDGDMGTADALRHIQRKIKVGLFFVAPGSQILKWQIEVIK